MLHLSSDCRPHPFIEFSFSLNVQHMTWVSAVTQTMCWTDALELNIRTDQKRQKTEKKSHRPVRFWVPDFDGMTVM